MTEERKTPSLKTSTLLAIAGVAALVGSAGFVMFVLPAEFHRDPTGFGKLTGLDRLAGPEVESVAAAPAGANQTARYYQGAFRSDVIEIVLPPDTGNELEYK